MNAAMNDWSTRNGALQILAVLAVLVCGAAAAKGQTESVNFKVACIARPDATDITHKQACLRTTPRLSFGDQVTLAVEHAPEASFDDIDEPNPADLVLFLNGKPLPGTHASVGKSQMADDGVTTTLLTYRITHNPASEKARANWKEVLLEASTGQPLAISTGLENGPAALSQALVEFVPVRTGRLLGWFLALVVGLVIFYLVAKHTGALRDKEPAGEDVKKATERAYSLSRVQAALWTVLAIYSFLYIWILTGEYHATIPASVVGLMGISLVTFGTAAAVDSNKNQAYQEKLDDVTQQINAKGTDDKLDAERATLELRSKVCKTEGFFKDLTTSAEGVGLHRLQLIVWTLALAVVFVWTVYRTLTMPDFDATLLGLMGISSGTYAALKVPENKT